MMVRHRVDKLDRISTMVRVVMGEERPVVFDGGGWWCWGCRFVVLETVVGEESCEMRVVVVILLGLLLWVKLLLGLVVLVWLLGVLGLLWVLRLCWVVRIDFTKGPVSVALVMLNIAIVAFTSVKKLLVLLVLRLMVGLLLLRDLSTHIGKTLMAVSVGAEVNQILVLRPLRLIRLPQIVV